MGSYLIGQPVVLYVDQIQNGAGVVTDPTTIDLYIRKPDGTENHVPAGQMTHVAASGSYEYQVVPAAGDGGTWAWRFVYDNPTNSNEGTFEVKESALAAPDGQQPITGPCGYWTDYDEVVRRGAIPDGVDDEAVYQAIAAASDVCFQLGGRRWPGVCDATVQVAGAGGGAVPWPEGGMVSMRAGMSWGWWAPSGTTSMFICGGSSLRLPGPVLSIDEIRVDGVALDADAYVIIEWSEVVRVDGGVWPAWGSLGDTVPRLEIDYSYGQAPPQIGRLAAAALARELVLAFANDDSCRLDRRVTSITREGISEDLALGLPGIAESLRDGQTGIPEVDLFVHAHNPKGLRRPARFVGLGGGEVSRRS